MTELLCWVISRDRSREQIRIPVSHVVNCGLTGPEEEVQRHAAELEKDGISVPDELPAMFPLPRQYLLQESEIDVLSPNTSGEVEFLLIPSEDEIYVGVGSDHTDRALETDDIPVSKAVCPNVSGESFWKLSDVERHWDTLRLRSWTGVDGDVVSYQDAPLDRLMGPRELLDEVEERITEPVPGLVIFSGTVSTINAELIHGDFFAAQLYDPVRDRSLTVEYQVRQTDWLS